mmetsp:Transcript_5696/g.18078  ORF Transcript_5696/g.18078 Transcript_5696/m.18078 type:complete len:404 (+) Transcript_5696:1567-2778(+)|eukprot:scaffold8862_cov122-Isochrysis_galbana.AAC.5
MARTRARDGASARASRRVAQHHAQPGSIYTRHDRSAVCPRHGHSQPVPSRPLVEHWHGSHPPPVGDGGAELAQAARVANLGHVPVEVARKELGNHLPHRLGVVGARDGRDGHKLGRHARLPVGFVHQLLQGGRELLANVAAVAQHQARHRRLLGRGQPSGRRKAAAAPPAVSSVARAGRVVRVGADGHHHQQTVEHLAPPEQRVLHLANTHAAARAAIRPADGRGGRHARRRLAGRPATVPLRQRPVEARRGGAGHELVLPTDDREGAVAPALCQVTQREGPGRRAVDRAAGEVGSRKRGQLAAPPRRPQRVEPPPERSRHGGPRPGADQQARLGRVPGHVPGRVPEHVPTRPGGAEGGEGGRPVAGRRLGRLRHPHLGTHPRERAHASVRLERLIGVAVGVC